MTQIEQWFSARGWAPFDYQRRAWAAYAAGQSGLIHAPTGLGKTFAVWLGPVMQAMRETGQRAPRPASGRCDHDPARVLWITPLRALANDTAQTLAEPITSLGLPWSLELRTGDTSSTVKQRQNRRPPTALVTTPESLSVMLSYRGAAERFATLRCVVVDEWHELMSTKRGVQTELSLARLRRCVPHLQTWGLSATLGNLDEALDVLLGCGPQRASGVQVSANLNKTIDVQTVAPESIERFPWAGHLGTRLVTQVVAAMESARTSLLFTNTRSQAELWFHAILASRPGLVGAVAIHHGSLEPRIRREVENLLRAGRLRAVVATSSLDLGVDFSPVDQVMQLGSPKGIARLLQRAGRSGHQPGATSRIIGVPTHAFELIEFAAARRAVDARRVEPRQPLRRALDVLAQHVVTIAAGDGFREDDLLQEVRTTHAYAQLTDDQWRWVMDFVRRGGEALSAYPDYARIVQDDDGRWVVASQRLARRHRMAIGTITSDASVKLAFGNGRAIGTVEESFISRLQPGDRFLFAGRSLELVRLRNMIAQVRRATGKRGAVPRWGGTRFPLSTLLADAVLQLLDEAGRGRFVGPEMQAVRPLLELQAEVSQLPAPGALLVETFASRDGRHYYIHAFQGRLVHEGLGAILAHRLTTDSPRTLTMNFNDYGIELLLADGHHVDVDQWRDLFDPETLNVDLLLCLNSTTMARRQFRDIARVAGLIFPGFPGQTQASRHLQASSDMFYDVFQEFDPDNMLLDQARREVLDQQLEVRRLQRAMAALQTMPIRLVQTEGLTPLSFPLWADRLREHEVSTEKWEQRMRRMTERLEAAAARGRTVDAGTGMTDIQSNDGSPMTRRPRRARRAYRPGV